MTEVIGVLVANQFLHISSQRFEFVYVIRVFGEQSFSAGLVFFSAEGFYLRINPGGRQFVPDLFTWNKFIYGRPEEVFPLIIFMFRSSSNIATCHGT